MCSAKLENLQTAEEWASFMLAQGLQMTGKELFQHCPDWAVGDWVEQNTAVDLYLNESMLHTYGFMFAALQVSISLCVRACMCVGLSVCHHNV